MLAQSTEEWRPVVGWEGFYEVSSQGRVRRHPYHGRRAELLLKPVLHKRGYLYVHLKRKPLRQARTIHSMVAEAFIGPYPPAHEVNHIDGDKLNCHPGNLEYLPHAANVEHGIATGLTNPHHNAHRPRGSAHINAKLSEDQVRAIRAVPHYFGIQSDLGREYGVSNVLIRLIRLGRGWAHVG